MPQMVRPGERLEETLLRPDSAPLAGHRAIQGPLVDLPSVHAAADRGGVCVALEFSCVEQGHHRLSVNPEPPAGLCGGDVGVVHATRSDPRRGETPEPAPHLSVPTDWMSLTWTA